MKSHLLVFLISILAHNSIHAETSRKDADVLAIVEQSGMKTWFHERSETRLARARKMIDRVNESIALHTDALDAQKKQALNRAIENFYASVQQSSSPDEQLQIWMNAFGSGITEKEAQKIRAFYESPLGERLIQSLAKASSAISAYNDRASEKLLNDKFNDFLAEANAIVNTTK